jgi:hypothetical protein
VKKGEEEKEKKEEEEEEGSARISPQYCQQPDISRDSAQNIRNFSGTSEILCIYFTVSR